MGRDRAGCQASAGWAGDLGLQSAGEMPILLRTMPVMSNGQEKRS
jgi:hypothetical protein